MPLKQEPARRKEEVVVGVIEGRAKGFQSEVGVDVGSAGGVVRRDRGSGGQSSAVVLGLAEEVGDAGCCESPRALVTLIGLAAWAEADSLIAFSASSCDRDSSCVSAPGGSWPDRGGCGGVACCESEPSSTFSCCEVCTGAAD